MPEKVVPQNAGSRVAVPPAGESAQWCETSGVPVNDCLLPLHNADPSRTWVGTRLGQRETHPQAANQKIRALGVLQHVKRGTDHEPF